MTWCDEPQALLRYTSCHQSKHTHPFATRGWALATPIGLYTAGAPRHAPSSLKVTECSLMVNECSLQSTECSLRSMEVSGALTIQNAGTSYRIEAWTLPRILVTGVV
jgi:hypothetical protein